MWYAKNTEKREVLCVQMKKYDVLYRDLKQKICSGEYRPEQKLPSKRMMADHSGCSVVTVQRAYEMLADEGYLCARQRSGYFVSAPEEVLIVPTRTTQVPDHLPVPPDPEPPELEHSVWFKTVRKVISEQGARLFVKAPGKGCAVLRNALADYLLRYRGMRADPACIVIGSGAEQLYQDVVKLLGRNKVYAVEDPCYDPIREAYVGMGATVRPLQMGTDGIRSTLLQQSDFDVLHVTPFHSYPTGVTAPLVKRYEYLRWAGQSGNYIVEDDFDSEFFMPGHPIESLYALDHAHRVIYINTFSKSISPAMRIGYMILPPQLLEQYDQVLGHCSCSVPVMDQYILAEFIASGSFERHLNRMRRKLKNQSRKEE